MSNKILALIILICTFGILMGGYFYLFVFYGASLTSVGNVSGYNINLSTDKIAQNLDYKCEKAECRYTKIPPLSYTVTISKDGYDSYVKSQKIGGKEKVVINFELEKTRELIKVSETSVEAIDVASQKRTRLKYRNFYLHYDFGKNGVFYIREYLGKLFLYQDIADREVLIYDFEKVGHDKIHISPVYGTDFVTVYVDGTNYLFNSIDASFRGIDLKQKIEYAKEGAAKNSIIFVTEIGVYIHNLQSLKSEYYVTFSDIVYLDDSVILGLLVPDDIKKRENLGIDGGNNYELYRYDTQTKESKKIYETSGKINEFYLEKNILFVEIDGSLKQLNNY